MHTTANAIITATFTTTTTTSIATICKAKSTEMKILIGICVYRLLEGHISNVLAMANCIKLELPRIDERDVLVTKGNMLIPMLLLVLPLLLLILLLVKLIILL